jgi:Cytochrome P460
MKYGNTLRILLIAATLLFGALTGIGLVARVHAGPERVAFPENYDQGVKWLIVDRADRKELQEHFVTRPAVLAARKGQEMPNGTVFTLVRYSALLDAEGNPRRGADGHFLKGEIAGYGVMEKRSGWGAEYPPESRNGEWEYRVFTPQKTPNAQMNLSVSACFECHKTQASHDFIHAYEKLQEASP